MPTTDRPQPRNASLAAFFSFLFPGLGQAYAGARRMAVLFAAPVLLLLISLLAATLLSVDRLRNEVLSATFLTAALVVNVALMAWRLAAIGQAGFAARPSIISRVTNCGLRTLERAICLAGKMVDPEYGGPTWSGVGIELPAGCQPYNGVHALAYARIRKGWIELPDGTREDQNDFKRAERQQKLLLELRHDIAQADLIFELPAILAAVGKTVQTDFPRSLAGDLASLLPLFTGPEIERVVLSYPQFVDLPTHPLVNYLLIPRRDGVQTEMQRLFGPGLVGWYLGTMADGPPRGGS